MRKQTNLKKLNRLIGFPAGVISERMDVANCAACRCAAFEKDGFQTQAAPEICQAWFRHLCVLP